jgi:hypothetical protein
MNKKILGPVIVNEMMEFYRGGPSRSVDPRIAYARDREAFDKQRGSVSPLSGVAKPAAPQRPGLKNR